MSNEKPIHFMLTSLNPIKYTIKLLYFALTWRTWFYRVSTVGCLEIVNRQTLTSVINIPGNEVVECTSISFITI